MVSGVRKALLVEMVDRMLALLFFRPTLLVDGRSSSWNTWGFQISCTDFVLAGEVATGRSVVVRERSRVEDFVGLVFGLMCTEVLRGRGESKSRDLRRRASSSLGSFGMT